MTASHSLECPTYMVPLSTAPQPPPLQPKHQADTQSNGIGTGWGVAGRGGPSGGRYSVYAAMKGAIEIYRKYAAKALGARAIRVNALAPGRPRARRSTQ
jgi:NAD(P)-dependent dehydrogenase (short-subunit alcohol dehydrogenase family)